MKYISTNRFSDFEFHDAKLEFVSFKDNTLIVSAEGLNIHKDTEQNVNEYDMEIDSAIITFENFEIVSLEPIRAYKMDENGKLYTDEPQVFYNGKEAEQILIAELKESVSLNGLNAYNENEKAIIEFDTNGEAVFNTVFFCTNYKIEWDDYHGRAWYTYYENYRFDITLNTPQGEQKNEIRISSKRDDDNCIVYVSAYVRYNEKDYFGSGKEYDWIDAIADLQKNLPNDVTFKSCVACKHGSMCPVGNCINEVFCVKDIVPKEKSDLFFYTEDDNEREKRRREFFYCCNDFAPQSEDYFTYNDYFYRLNK